MRSTLEFPRLSLAERDRRWSLVREQMDRVGLDCLVLWGWPAVWDFCTANARYLCPVGGNAEFNVLVFPRQGEPTCYVQMPTFVEGWRRAQDWVEDIRPRKGTWADSVAMRLKDLGFTASRIGMDGLAGPLDPDGWLPHSVYERLTELLPRAEIVNLDDMLEKVRAIKSAEEIAAIRQAAALGDLMLAACADVARPGVKECEVYGRMVETMLANGGEEPTLFLWGCDQHPFPHPFRMPTTRHMQPGDYITCEIHPKIGGYFTHVERTFCLGEPDEARRHIYDGCLVAYRRGLELFGPGKRITECMDAVKQTIDGSGLAVCEAGIHGHGLASLEYPRYRHHAIGADTGAIKAIGDEFRPGMVFAFNIDLVDPNYRGGDTGCAFAETIVISENGADRMHSYPLELQSLPTVARHTATL
jgi:Xaa-Pro dipeptidase